MINSKKNEIRRKYFFGLGIFMISVLFIMLFTFTVFASDGGVGSALSSFMEVLFTVTKIVGVGLALWGVIQLVMALIGHDPNQRLTALFFLGGGVMVFFAKEIIELMGVRMPV